MREIKFRGLRTDGKGWVYGMLFHNNKIVTETVSYESPLVEKGSPCYKYDYINIIPESVGQFTGLKDLKGNDIFEGDILKGGIYLEYPVEWDLEDNGWNIKNEYNIRKNFEIIGNIHENPELINLQNHERISL